MALTKMKKLSSEMASSNGMYQSASIFQMSYQFSNDLHVSLQYPSLCCLRVALWTCSLAESEFQERPIGKGGGFVFFWKPQKALEHSETDALCDTLNAIFGADDFST